MNRLHSVGTILASLLLVGVLVVTLRLSGLENQLAALLDSITHAGVSGQL